jgi:hypothetical protein
MQVRQKKFDKWIENAPALLKKAISKNPHSNRVNIPYPDSLYLLDFDKQLSQFAKSVGLEFNFITIGYSGLFATRYAASFRLPR